MTVSIISSVYGDYDTPAPPLEQSIDCDWIMVTDGETVIPEGWHTVTEPRRHMHPRLAAKVAKCRPDLYSNADVTIWIDASFVITSPRFAAWCVDSLGSNVIAQIRHPDRGSIVDEADISSKMEKYNGQPVVEQARHYVSRDGHPDRFGLWATGLIVRCHWGAQTEVFGDWWLREQIRWSYQDQISEPYVLNRLDMRPTELDGELWHHPMFGMQGHRSDL